MGKIKVAIAEDHVKFRTVFLKMMKHEGDLDFIIVADNGADLIKQLEERRPDIILMDISMPVMDGVEASRAILKKSPGTKIIAFTTFEDEGLIIEMSKLGLKSFVGKNQAEEIPKAIRTVHDGGAFYPDKIARIINQYLIRSTNTPKLPFTLSEEELALIQNISLGHSSSEIAKSIKRSPRTVEKYRNQLYEKFGVSNKEQLIVKASHFGLLK